MNGVDSKTCSGMLQNITNEIRNELAGAQDQLKNESNVCLIECRFLVGTDNILTRNELIIGVELESGLIRMGIIIASEVSHNRHQNWTRIEFIIASELESELN